MHVREHFTECITLHITEHIAERITEHLKGRSAAAAGCDYCMWR